jgi:hypothetical protein
MHSRDHIKSRPDRAMNSDVLMIDNVESNTPNTKNHSQNHVSPKFMLDIWHEMNSPQVDTSASSNWQEKDIAQLEASVIGVARSQGIHPPRYNELSTCYADGEFQSDHAFDFWCRVAKLVRTHNHDECYLKYNEIHGSNVARFYVTEHAMPHKRHGHSTHSGHDMDELFGEINASSHSHARRHHSAASI